MKLSTTHTMLTMIIIWTTIWITWTFIQFQCQSHMLTLMLICIHHTKSLTQPICKIPQLDLIGLEYQASSADTRHKIYCK